MSKKPGDKFIDESSEFGRTEEEDRLNLIKILNNRLKVTLENSIELLNEEIS